MSAGRGGRRALTAAAAVAGPLLLLWLDGWFAGAPGAPSASPPPALAEAVARSARDLADRARAFSSRPLVARSLQGGGIALDRAALFSAASQTLENAPSGSWISLTDREGNVHAWWGDAPSPVPQALVSEGYAVLWSASTATLVYRRAVGSETRVGIVTVARVLPAEAPDFGLALGLDRRDAAWRPVAAGVGFPLFRSGGAEVWARPVALSREIVGGRRGALGALLVLAVAGFLIASGTAGSGSFLALSYLTLVVACSDAPRALAVRSVWPLAIGVLAIPLALASFRRGEDWGRAPIRTAAGWGLLIVCFLAATGIRPPELTTAGREWRRALLDVAGVTALLFASLAFGAAARPSRRTVRTWTTAAVVVTTVAILASLAFVTSGPAFPAVLFVAVGGCFELWTRAAGPRSDERYALPRLLAASGLLLVLIVSPLREHARIAEAFRVASAIRLPDPDRPSTGAVAVAQQASDRASRFDLASELPAPPDGADLSDLAYRMWRDFAEGPGAGSLISYEVLDSSGRSRSRFSLIPEPEAGEVLARTVRIDRYELAVVRRIVPLVSAGVPWGVARIDVADWPPWDPLPPRIGVYRRLVLGAGASARGAGPPRPLVAAYSLDGEARDEGPPLLTALRERLSRSQKPEPARFTFRGEEWRGEIRPLPGGYRLVALPVPTFFGRLLTAALLLPDVLLVCAAGTLLLLTRALVGGGGSEAVPNWIRTFRGRLVALFVGGVLVPLFAVTFFLRGQVEARSASDTFDHARTALGTAKRVLDDYLPSAGAGRRIGLLDDTLLAWLANAVGYDLSVYDPEGTLVATSRRDLYASGLVPDRAPASVYVAVGLQGAAQQAGSRRVAGSRFEEVTTALSAIPGVRGLASPGLLSLLLLPQQQVAAAEAEQLTAAVWAFSLLVFVLSAAVAARLAVRVARPVADLVAGTRAVARGDFSPHLEEPPDEELKELVRAFLSMSQSIKQQTEAVSREKERLATLLSNLTAGVVALGEGGRVLLANPAAVSLGGGDPAATTIDELFPGDAFRLVRDALRPRQGASHSAEIEPRPGERWRIVSVALPLASEGDRMVVIEDVSDVVRSNRLAAWAEMARIIAHEIKNPLTPIRLSVEHLREVWRRGSPEFGRVLEDCVANVLRQTEELRRSAAEFADYSRLPEPRIQPVDVGHALREGAAAFAGAPGIRWSLQAGEETMAEADPRLLARVFANLIGNSVEALGTGGGRIALSARRRGDRVEVVVEDDGPGVAAGILPRLFEPYFSARSGGTGLGLAIVKKILEEHSGSISAENRAEGGFRVTFDLPAPRPAVAGPATATTA